jgi:hypothetical protein
MSKCGQVALFRFLLAQQFEHKATKTILLRHVFPAQLSVAVPAELNLPGLPPEPGIPVGDTRLERARTLRVEVNTIEYESDSWSRAIARLKHLIERGRSIWILLAY